MVLSDDNSRVTQAAEGGFTGFRSMLFVPGSRPDRIPKALSSHADAVIIDLEDAVAASDKESARRDVNDYLTSDSKASVIIRVNSPESQWFSDDLAMCAGQAGVSGVMVPKAESADQLTKVTAIGKPVWPLVETVKGVLELDSLLNVGGVVRATFGALDLCAELGLTPGSDGAQRILDQCRYNLVMYSFLRDLEPPIESVFPDFSNAKAIEIAAKRAQEMGFTGMLCIHPNQIDSIHKAFTPDREEVEWARKVLSLVAENDAAFRMDGQMIDAPVIARAKKVLARIGEGQ